MIMLSTRLATYCTVLIPLAMLAIYGLLLLLKKEVLKKSYPAFLVVMIALSAFIIPYGPAYQNQLIDAYDYGFIKNEENQREEARDLLKDAEGLEKWTDEWRDFYVYMFEDYSFLINVTPPIY